MGTIRKRFTLCCVVLLAAAIFLLCSSSAKASTPHFARFYGHHYYGHYYPYNLYRPYYDSPHVYFRYPRYSYGYYYSPLFMPRYYFWPKYDHDNPCFYPGGYFASAPYFVPNMDYRAGGVIVRVRLVSPDMRLASTGGRCRISVTVETRDE